MAIKTGYFRITGDYNITMSYKELYDRGKDYINFLKNLQDSGRIQLFCACQPENTLELTITKAMVLRVKNNGQQDLHLQSCPKSEKYSAWIIENESGVRSTEDERICFNISIPTGIKSSGGSSGGSSDGPGDPMRKRTNLPMMARTVNCIAWEKQTYSVRKAIGTARKEKRRPDWNYKDLDAFNRLFFGVSNEIYLQNKGNIFPLHDVCYRTDTFYQSDFKGRFFMYATIDKISEIKEERKYQYITVQMPSNKSNKKATVRVLTEDFNSLIEDVDFSLSVKYILTGWIRHDVFPGTEGQTSEWITLLKGSIIPVTKHGLCLDNVCEESLIDALCNEHIVFTKPYHKLENYGSETPTVMIERLNGKNIIVDVCTSSQMFNQRSAFASNNPEYEVILLHGDDYDADMVVYTIKDKLSNTHT